jgi:hypothetical protein
MKEKSHMNIKKASLILALVFLLVGMVFAADQKTAAPTPKTAQPEIWGEGYATPQAAADALIAAAAAEDTDAMLKILGPQSKSLISSADPVRDKSNAKAFASLAKDKLMLDTSNPGKAVVEVGPNEWPLPIPIVKRADGRWYYDTKAGTKEILYRRIGNNELDAIRVCRNYVAAQHEYAMQAHDGINQYAQKIISTPGKKDGLYWQNEDGTPGGPLSEGVAKALAEGYTLDKPTAFHGYYFKILKGQGPNAPLGKLDYVIEGVMIGGFALVAVPADYRMTGVKTFLVNNTGIIYEKDLGADSLELVKKMDVYNPDKTWQRTDDSWTVEEAKE